MDNPNLAAPESAEIVSADSAPSTVTGIDTVQDLENQNLKDVLTTAMRSESHRHSCWVMYVATLEGYWPTAEKLLKKEPDLVRKEITERGDRALHLAISLKHKKFVQKLVKMMDPADLRLQDRSGDTAVSCAAFTGVVETAKLLITKNDGLLGVQNKEGCIPLQMSFAGGEKKMIRFLLKKTEKDSLTREGWFDLMVKAISFKMYDVALEILDRDKNILKRDESLDTMRTKEGLTALHVLAGQDILEVSTSRTATILKSILGTKCYGRQNYGGMQFYMFWLVEELLRYMQQLLGKTKVFDELSKPPILNDAAKVGNVDLIYMLNVHYPDLMFQKENDKFTIFHIAVMHRRDQVFRLIKQDGRLKNFIFKGIDEDGHIMLLLAANLAPPLDKRNGMESNSALQMQRELAWFKEVEDIIPIRFGDIEKNNERKKLREKFSEEHKELLRESITWMRSTADSCMLIATIILTVVYAAAFTVPGGNNQETGLPILANRKWFICFFIFEALALFGSTLCIITFWSIKSSDFDENQFLDILPYQLKVGLSGLFGSLVGAISAFMSAYCLVFINEGAWLVKCLLLLIYVVLVLAICGRFIELWFSMKSPKALSRMLSNPRRVSRFKKMTWPCLYCCLTCAEKAFLSDSTERSVNN